MFLVRIAERSKKLWTHPSAPILIEEILALKWAELDAFAAMLRPSLRSAKGVDPARWVTHLTGLANLDDLSRSLDEDYRRLANADSVSASSEATQPRPV